MRGEETLLPIEMTFKKLYQVFPLGLFVDLLPPSLLPVFHSFVPSFIFLMFIKYVLCQVLYWALMIYTLHLEISVLAKIV